MSRSRAAVVLKTAFELRIRPASSPWRPRRARSEVAPLRKSCLTASRWVSRTRKRRSNSVKVGSSSPKALERSAPRPCDRHRGFLLPGLEGGAGLGVEGAEDLVELDRFGDVWRVGQGAAVGELRPVAVARGQFDVGLAEQRLGAQDRPRVRRDRRVLVVDVDRGQRLFAVGRQVDVLHLADRDAGDPHVGLLGELGRLVEGDLDLVGLRLERGRAAEGDPEEEQDAEAGQREAGDDEELGCAGGALAHSVPGPQQRVGPWIGGIGGSSSWRGIVAPWSRVCEVRLAAGEAVGRGRCRCRRSGPGRAASGRPASSRLKVALRLWLSQGR